jgi:hypothetical protein
MAGAFEHLVIRLQTIAPGADVRIRDQPLWEELLHFPFSWQCSRQSHFLQGHTLKSEYGIQLAQIAPMKEGCDAV